MTENELKVRTKQFAQRAINLVNALPKSQTGKVLGTQLLRSATSVGEQHVAQDHKPISSLNLVLWRKRLTSLYIGWSS